MKELSIEEKAKRYDEAIEKFDVILNLNTVKKSGTIFADDVRKILPELKESDDERMIQYFKDLAPFDKADELYEKYGFSHKDAIAWLEKQGEHAKFRDSIQVGDKVTRNQDGVLVNLSQLKRVAKPSDDIDTEKQGEQNPAWSEEDEEMFDAIIADIQFTQKAHNHEVNQIVYEREIDWLKSIKDRVGCEANCTTTKEWSEEDEQMFEHIIEKATLKFSEWNCLKNDEINFLKSLHPQNKQEWTQDDIDMIDWLIRCCEKEHEELCNDRYGHQDIVSDLKRDCRKKWDWLESLKEKVAPQTTWKPSDEQMKAFDAILVYNPPCSNECRNHLITLYNELKKLREE